MATLVIQKLPEIAQAIAAPLAKTDKMVFVSTGGGEGGQGGESGPAMFTRTIAQVLSQLPSAVEGLTGFDLREAMERLNQGKHGTHTLRDAQKRINGTEDTPDVQAL